MDFGLFMNCSVAALAATENADDNASKDIEAAGLSRVSAYEDKPLAA